VTGTGGSGDSGLPCSSQPGGGPCPGHNGMPCTGHHGRTAAAAAKHHQQQQQQQQQQRQGNNNLHDSTGSGYENLKMEFISA